MTSPIPADGARRTGAVPPEAVRVFGDRLPLAQQYADLLTAASDRRGLLGPRELPRIWQRHLDNCAVVTDLLPLDARVVDVGSGAGLPGIVLACRRADLTVDLVESMRRRVDFLTEAVAVLGLADRVRVVHGRVEDAAVIDIVGSADWVTARAVAPLDRLARWCLPLLRPGGSLLAMKGAGAAAELREHAAAIRQAGAVLSAVVSCGADILTEPATVVQLTRGSDPRADRRNRSAD